MRNQLQLDCSKSVVEIYSFYCYRSSSLYLFNSYTGLLYNEDLQCIDEGYINNEKFIGRDRDIVISDLQLEPSMLMLALTLNTHNWEEPLLDFLLKNILKLNKHE